MPLSKAGLSEEINVLFDSGAGMGPQSFADRLHVLTDEALQDVKLSLKLRGWFTSNQTLVSIPCTTPAHSHSNMPLFDVLRSYFTKALAFPMILVLK